MKKLVLCILDGCGVRDNPDGNAFKNANKPTFDMLMSKYPHSILQASGKAVGLPEGQMGTSEVGHMNLGSGRVALQPLQAITEAIEDGSINNNEEIKKVFDHVKKNKSNLHFMGLLSDGGVHSHINHLLGFIDMCKKNKITNVYFDLFMDGRDTYEKSALKYLDMLNDKIKEVGFGKISTISGRYYGMDRDDNFDRLKLYYDALCYGKGPKYNNYRELIEDNYASDITDEFIIPGIINKCPLNDNDGIIVFNFRKDRLREMFTLLSNPNEYEQIAKEKDLIVRKYNNLKIVTMYPVVSTVTCPHAFDDDYMENMLVEHLHNNGLSQMRIAETEKFPHVTFFFDGGKEFDYDDMKKVLIPSPKVATYDMQPEMSVYKVTDAFLNEVANYDVTIMNLANGDMVGHTGVYEAAVEAV
jgi:2,3-bisphosphoglycerate-independent phosphoglycerate mutase